MHTIDFIILAVVLVLVFFAARYAWRHRHTCCGNCSGCSHCQSCQSSKKAKKP